MSPAKVQEPWWDEEDGNPAQVARAVFETVKDIERRQQSIHDGHRRHARIYAGYTPGGLDWGSTQGVRTREPHEVTRSVIRSVCDTATALISKFRPKPSFVTDGADWGVQQAAVDLDRFMVGAYEAGGVYPAAARAFHDSTVFGTGAWKLVPRGTGRDFRVCAEHVLIDDLVVDENECREHLEPINTYHRVPMRADALIKRYAQGKTAKARELAQRVRAAMGHGGTTWPGNRFVPPDRLIVIDAVHTEEDGTGRRVLSFDGWTLEDESWDFPWHPYVVLHWAQPLSGFYGDGIAYRQFGRQQRISFMYRWLHRCHDLFGTPRAWVDPAGGPPTLQISNEIGSIIATRRPPVFQTQAVVPPEIYRWLDGLERGAFEDEGISQASASNQLPPGIESAPAQREYSFKEGTRFAPVSQRWEDAIAVENCRKMTAMYRAASRSGSTASVPWANRRLREQIDWKSAALEEDSYQIRPEASSLEALSPSSRTQAAIELSQTGWIAPQEGRALLGHPDLAESDKIDSAGTRYANWAAQQLVRGVALSVNELANLVELRRVVGGFYLDMYTRNAPRDLLGNFERFLEDLDALTPQPAPAGPPMPGMSAPAAQGSPAALPGG